MLIVASNIKHLAPPVMSERGLSGLVLSAGAGALAAAAGMFLFNKVKNRMRQKPHMKLQQNHLYLSTRCTWLISELGAESDFEVGKTVEGPPPQAFLSNALEGAGSSAQGAAGGSAPEYQPVVQYNPYVSEDEYLMEYDYDSDGPSLNTLPAMVVNDDFTMIEGAALCMYMADLYGQFLPDADSKAEYYSWITYSAATFDSLLKTLQQQLVDTPARRRDPATLEPALKGYHAFARALAETLEHREYLCGDNFTAADCVLGFTLYWAYTIDRGQLVEAYPPLTAYLARLRRRPAFRKTFGNSDNEWDWSRFFYTYVRGIKR